jgi:hypothetical protein
MPQPTYIICAESYSQDANTGLLSFFHVLEGFEITIRRSEGLSGGAVFAKPSFYGIAQWSCADDELNQEFQYQCLVKRPSQSEPQIQVSKTFIFSKRSQRFILGLLLADTAPESGDFVFQCRVRKDESDPWIVQEYRFPITVQVQDSSAEPH